jgi:localization factor PodJL
MADYGLPWSIKGVSAEARIAAREAAKRAGLPVGVWLTRTIREIAAAEAEARKDAPSPEATSPDAPVS